MPIIAQSRYRPSWPFTNAHVQTVYPTLFRKVAGVGYRRERIDTPDGDFVDLDFSEVGSDRIAIILHGLEGDSSRQYMLGMVQAFNRSGRDAVAMNFRGCSGECNRKLRFYHSGDSGDLHTVVTHVLQEHDYAQVALIGFSLGANVVLKYLGEQGDDVLPQIRKAVAFSVPCDLGSCSHEISSPVNRLYLKRFLRMLREKIRMKMRMMPDLVTDHGYETIKTFKDFDDRYTAPMSGFKDAEDYWEKCSCKPFLTSISVPTLVISAADDPFLGDPCYPREEALANPNLSLEIPRQGGHVGFVSFNGREEYWSETRAVEFVNS
ncbi:MAG: alpha/beta fold hydrolase [Pseudomonadota bacterium]